jgi:hypothetical protein
MADQTNDHRDALRLIAPNRMSASAMTSQPSSDVPVNGSRPAGFTVAPSSEWLFAAVVMRGVVRACVAPSVERVGAGAAAAELAGVGAAVDGAGEVVALESVREDPVVEPVRAGAAVEPFPPPTCSVPVELVDVLLPPGVVPTGPPTVVPPVPAVGVACVPDDWTAPVDPVAVLPPPT